VPLTERLRARVLRDFGVDAASVEDRIALASDSERIQAAAVLWADGDPARLTDVLRLVQVDWRDALVRAGLENDDWPQKLDEELGESR
jgi:hypothetical protein